MQKLIEKRKKKRRSTLTKETVEDEIEVRKAKKKKKKHEDNNNNNEDDDSILDDESCRKSKKSKKSNKVNIDTDIEEEPKKKKKKNQTSMMSDQKIVSSDTENHKNDENKNDKTVEEETIKTKKKKKKKDKQSGNDEENNVEEKNDKVNSEKAKEKENGIASEEGQENDKTEDAEKVFPVLGKQQHKTKQAVKRNLPRWLAQPTIINTSSTTDKTDTEIKLSNVDFLSQTMINNLTKMDIKHLFPVQSCVIPTVMNLFRNKKPCFPCRDICVQSPTGSGKTLTYVLPVIEAMSKNIIRDLQCLVVLPTKDLAAQVKATFDQCLVGTSLKVGLVAGVKSFAKEQESIITSRYIFICGCCCYCCCCSCCCCCCYFCCCCCFCYCCCFDSFMS